MPLISRLCSGWASLEWRELAFAARSCPFCGPSVFVRINADETGVRCLRCAASAVHVAMGWVLREQSLDLGRADVCEFSARGPLVNYLRRKARSVALSEYFVDLSSGSLRGEIRCEDMQRLSYANASFDLITHTEVLEHVPDEQRAFAELLRVLRPGGRVLFTVPLHDATQTLERARLRDGVVEHLELPVYHCDPLRGGSGILAFRDYGRDILVRLKAAGFIETQLLLPQRVIPWITPRRVVLARAPNPSGCSCSRGAGTI